MAWLEFGRQPCYQCVWKETEILDLELYKSGKNEVDGCVEIALSSGPLLGAFHNLFNYISTYIHMVVFFKLKSD